VPEPAAPAVGIPKLVHLDELSPLEPRENQLRDALAVRHGEGLAAVVDQDHADLAAVIGIDGPRRYAL
jgi:hypothetical protein